MLSEIDTEGSREGLIEVHKQLNRVDSDLIEAAKETADRLHVDDVHEVAAALTTMDKRVFTGIHIEPE